VTAAGSSARPPAAGPLDKRALAGRSPATVAGNENVGSLVWLTLTVPGWPGARPGQFALLQAEDSCCFLARPLSVAQQDGETVSFVVAPIGQGTRELCGLDLGGHVWVLGPLGNGFDPDALCGGPGRTVIVGGGVGAAPFPLLLSSLDAPAREVLLLLGFRDAPQAAGAAPALRAASMLAERGMTCRTQIVTEDGSLGRAERVTDALQREIRAGDRLAVCGPWAMTEAVARVCAAVPDVDIWFNVEAGMACGVGSCHGCVVPLADGESARVCREGPVFTAQALFGRGWHTGDGRGER
jgi:dihydroorotate dehydrogenase electron transfer subunit